MERLLHMLLYRAFHAQRNYLRGHLGELGLGSGQPKLLGYLAQNGPSRQRQIADYFEIDPAAVCRMLDALCKSGFVTRRVDQGNRRADIVELTEKGYQAHLQWKEYCSQVEQIMLRDFSDEERTRFLDYLARAYRNLKENEEEGHK
ncbi:MarR family winged helix-turn-helix transcriptional regulator [uncultured Ruthenibacterium sp.]|uniref:MarR family winged helix-turn-helix transcriptional regulator n=1 Tax=uncultured Ruthenibacterium sp. TaxID=1905347 RepID=UPI00349EE055